jgi:ketosteroid isomerase-like protein
MPTPDLAAWSQGFFDDVANMRVEAIERAYAPTDDLLVFLEGPRWQTVGHDAIARGWRALAASPMRVESVTWIDGPHGMEGADLAVVAGTVEIAYRVGTGAEVRTVRWRDTHVLRPENGGGWLIVHEHVSAPTADPYGFGDWLPASGSTDDEP